MPTISSTGLITEGKRIQLKPYQPRAFIPREYLTDAELIQHAGTDLILDGEFYPNYAMFGFKHPKTGKYLVLENDFNPRKLSWIMFSYRTIGFNSIHFDLPLVWAAYHNRNPAFLKAVTNAIIVGGMRPKDAAKEYGFEMFKLPQFQHIDLIEVCPLGASLKLYGARLHSKRLQDLPFPDDQPLEDWQKDVVRDYNGNDLDVTETVFTFKPMQERIELRRVMSIEYDEDLLSKSDAQIAEAVIPKEVGKLTRKWIKRPEIAAGTVFKYKVPSFLGYATKPLQDLLAAVRKAEFIVGTNSKGLPGKIVLPPELECEINIGKSTYRLGIGGLHSSEKNVSYVSNSENTLYDTDMVSFYPAIIMNLELFPIALGPQFLPIYGGFRDQRVTAKANKNFAKDKGLKILLNGMSGKLSDPYSKMYSPDLTIQVTVTGQLTLLMLIEMLECNGIPIVSANTDGIVAYVNKADREKMKYWVDYFEKLTGFKTEETEYKSYYARDINAYFAVKKDGGVKVKGPYSEVGSQSGTQLDNNPIMLICSDAIQKFLSVGKPIEETISQCKDITRFLIVRQVKGGGAFRGEYLGKTVRWYYSKTSTDCIQSVMSGNKVATSDNCQPCMDLPSKLPPDVDLERYIQLTKEILYDINYYQKPTMTRFF